MAAEMTAARCMAAAMTDAVTTGMAAALATGMAAAKTAAMATGMAAAVTAVGRDGYRNDGRDDWPRWLPEWKD